MSKQPTTKSPRKVYAAVIAISFAVMATIGLLSTWVTYPTQQHRAVVQQEQRIIDQHGGGVFNVDAMNSKEYTKLATSSEATYSSYASGIVSLVYFIIYCILLGLVYKYIRSKNVSPTRRALGATTLFVVIGSQLATLALLLPNHWFTHQPFTWGAWTIPAYLMSFATNIVLTFVIVWFFERGYNKSHSFTVE